MIGVVGGFEQPSITKELEAFKLGAAEIDPEVRVLEIYVNINVQQIIARYLKTDVVIGQVKAIVHIRYGRIERWRIIVDGHALKTVHIFDRGQHRRVPVCIAMDDRISILSLRMIQHIETDLKPVVAIEFDIRF